MPNTKTGTTWAPDIRPESIETFTETYTPEGGEEQTVTYKRVADHPILNGIRDKLAFFMTHAGAVWYNKQANRTVADEIRELNAKTDYSYEEERCVGTWIDGKPLYRKAFYLSPNWQGGSTFERNNIPHGIDGLNEVVRISGSIYDHREEIEWNHTIPTFSSDGDLLLLFHNVNKINIVILNKLEFATYGLKLSIVMEYTKTSD